MKTSSISRSYWRSILRGMRTFEAVPAALREEVRFLARQAVEDGELSREDYLAHTGEEYQGPAGEEAQK